ncbi:MAG: DeoR/GlpR transcriptional regulator [Pseudorhodobacter sp.]|nr:MAG: DeoR/GlpR transcriptional regulator [Pseudorhodobacter sp.]
MTLPPRQSEILALARSMGQVMAEDLARHFGVAVQTIRRDLGDLADLGFLDRIHGGAVPRQGLVNITYERRRKLNAAGKAAIGAAVAAAVPENSAIILTLGTTVEAVAQALLHHRSLTVITNNMNVANILGANPGCEVIVTGGALRRSDGGLVGALTAEFFAQFKVDIAILGASALDRDGDLLDYDLAEVRVSRAILAQARTRFVVADQTKLSRSAPARIASLSEVSRLFTDQPLPADLAQRCRDWGCDVVVAPPLA